MTEGAIGFVAIGRNEGERLIACLTSLRAAGGGTIVYVDSGSTDDSVNAAARLGAEVIALDMSVPFTAARARNAGARRLIEISNPQFIQFIDSDCTLADGWLANARAFLEAHPETAVVCGRRRERRPQATLYNGLCDIEWDTPVGEAIACGGDALMRVDALNAAGFYNESLVAGEEPELCVRIRERSWKIWRIDAEMTAHDAAMTKFSQWWTRSMRAGHAYAEVSALHRNSPRRIWARETKRALIWFALAPASILLGLAVSPWFALALCAYPAQGLRLFLLHRRRFGEIAAPAAALSIVGKFAESAGALKYYWSRMIGRRAGLFEYK
jgi:GT2 family glycosyltransferase